jgi:hypothetical protein
VRKLLLTEVGYCMRCSGCRVACTVMFWVNLSICSCQFVDKRIAAQTVIVFDDYNSGLNIQDHEHGRQLRNQTVFLYVACMFVILLLI